MSWDQILTNMLAYNGTDCGCIAGVDGSMWASSPNFKPTQEEIAKIVQVASTGAPESVTIGGNKVITVRAGDKSLSATGNEFAIDVRVLNTCVVIAGNSKPKENPGVNRLLAAASGSTGDYLAKSNY